MCRSKLINQPPGNCWSLKCILVLAVQKFTWTCKRTVRYYFTHTHVLTFIYTCVHVCVQECMYCGHQRLMLGIFLWLPSTLLFLRVSHWGTAHQCTDPAGQALQQVLRLLPSSPSLHGHDRYIPPCPARDPNSGLQKTLYPLRHLQGSFLVVVFVCHLEKHYY